MKIALIGLGMVAQTHVRAIADARPALELALVHARDQKRAHDFAKLTEPVLGYRPGVAGSVAQIANTTDLDFIILATPPDARLKIIETLSAAGKPILLEKPVERDLARATEIVEVCERQGVTLGVVFQQRTRSPALKLRELLRDGALGHVGLCEITVPWWRDQGYYDAPGRGTFNRDGGGVLITQAIHTLDLVLCLIGPVKRVQAMARTTALHTMEAEDFVTAGLEFASGAVGSLVASTASFPGGGETITLHGELASACLRPGELQINWRSGESEVFGAKATSGGGVDPMAFGHGPHQAIVEDFASAIADGNPPLVTGREALRVHALIDALQASSRTGRAVDLAQGG